MILEDPEEKETDLRDLAEEDWRRDLSTDDGDDMKCLVVGFRPFPVIAFVDTGGSVAIF